MAVTGIDALNRTQASAEAEVGSIDGSIKECSAWIGVAAVYDDPWATPVTGCQVRIKVEGELVADGPRTKGLSAYGKEDGQPHDDVRAKLGIHHQNGVKSGSAVIALVPEGADDSKDIEQQIRSQLAAFEMSMRELLKPWIEEWSKHGWWSIQDAKRRGQMHGFEAWRKEEVGFWGSAGETAKEVWDGVTSGAVIEKAQALWGYAGELWDRRKQLMNLLKAFAEGSVKAIEKALESLVDLPGELGEVFNALVQHSVDWVENMIEVARETDVFKRATKTIMAIVMMMTPNFWVEGIGMVEGYLLPEVLVTIVLIIIGALCAAAGASALALRITGLLSKLRAAVGTAGRAARVLFTLFDKLDAVAKLIGKLSRALRRRRHEVISGETNKTNQIVRRSASPLDVNPPASRHSAKKVNQKTVAKEVNTVVEPRVDMNADVAAIKEGHAAVGRAPGGDVSYTVNGRTYGAHPNGTLYPIEGDGFHTLDRDSFKALGVYNKFGDTPRAAEIMKNMSGLRADQQQRALSVWKTYQ